MSGFDDTSMTLEDIPDLGPGFGGFEEVEKFTESESVEIRTNELGTKVSKYVTELLHYPYIELDLLEGLTKMEHESLKDKVTQEAIEGLDMLIRIPEGLFNIGLLPKVSITSFLETFGEERISYHADANTVYRGRMVTALNP